MERLTEHDNGRYVARTGFTYWDLVDRLAAYEDAEERGELVRLPCGKRAKLMYKGEEYEADHWNITLTATKDDEKVAAGYRVHLFSVEEAEAALKGGKNGRE